MQLLIVISAYIIAIIVAWELYLQRKELTIQSKNMVIQTKSIQKQMEYLTLERQRIMPEGYSSFLEKLIEFKQWVLSIDKFKEGLIHHPYMPDEYRNPDGVEYFMNMANFYYYLEYLFYLVRSELISKDNQEGFTRELGIWLRQPGARKHFNDFAKSKQPHSKLFIDKVQELYDEIDLMEQERIQPTKLPID